MPPPSPPNPKPYASIITITAQPEDHIKKSLSALCHEDDKTRERAYMYMGKLVRHAKELEKNNDAAAAAGTKKRTMLDVEICMWCAQTFHKDNNYKEHCFHHPDKIVKDGGSRFWYHWDKGRDGPIDTETNRKNFPGAFVYPCCGKNGTTKGCTWGYHIEPEDPPAVYNDHYEQDRRVKRTKIISDMKQNSLPVKKATNLPSAWLKCVRCSTLFSNEETSETSCCYHDGE
ncbi:hypothetical protein QBC37DRAFT_389200 [Rhypophila decipiens]|uniref:C2H2-type domain-containing protein n=1 Tax=Rhypophila decipiens TaxID=261697 RepID=A0AAN6Y3K8_9PEZI|nr:hypothetical protein QBC37DRAFT_389200 [Rhypophila decipiens]